MASCRNCGQEVTFKPHPRNPEKLAPFDSDGEIHFARCRQEKPKREFRDIAEIGKCHSCSANMTGVADFIIAGGASRLAAICPYGHRRQIPDTPGNRSLINRVRIEI